MLSYILAYLVRMMASYYKGPERRSKSKIVVGTRNSVLAMAQTNIVVDYIKKTYPDVEIVTEGLQTEGDRNQKQALHQMEAKSLWTLELEELLLSHKMDIIVHSLKDMPTQIPEHCVIGAIVSREDPRDALVMRAGLPYCSLSELPPGSVVGTSSVRRMAHIRRLYPHLTLTDARGNVPRRLQKLDDHENFGYDALILAAAGLIRLNLQNRITMYLTAPEALHAVGQGAIAIELREGDTHTQNMLDGINHEPTAKACLAERALMRRLEGGCSVPIGVASSWGDDAKTLTLMASVSSPDGEKFVEVEMHEEVTDIKTAEAFGVKAAERLIELGCQPILDAIENNRRNTVKKN